MKKLLKLFVSICVIGIISINSAFAYVLTWENPKSIRTYIEPNSKKEMMKKAFAQWTTMTNGRLVFKYVNSPKDAQIIVNFVKDASKFIVSEYAIGVTNAVPKVSNGKIVFDTATIKIADHIPGRGGRLMPNDRIYRVMVHEIGHAVGFQGDYAHSTDKNSLMYPTALSRTQTITKEDMKFLSKIYGW